MTDEAVVLLQQVPLFVAVPAPELARLATRLRRQHFRRGTVLCRYGDPAGALYILARGQVKVTLPNEEGEETVLSVLGPGACRGEVAALDGGPPSATVTALGPVETFALHREDLLAMVRDHSAVALALIATLAGRLRRSDARLEDIYFHDLDTRLARKLLDLAQEHGRATPAGVEVPLPLTQAELASMVGAGRPRVSMLLGAYQDAGLLRLSKGSFTVLQPDALRRRAGR